MTGKHTLAATTLAVYLSLNVEVRDDKRGDDFFAFPLLSLVWLLTAAWLLQAWVVKVRREWEAGTARVRRQWTGLANRLRVAFTVTNIGWQSLAWGLGI